MSYEAPPTGGFAPRSWLPPNVNRIPALASTNSQDSVMSQIPLQYHLPIEYQSYDSGSDYSSPAVPQQAWGQPPQYLGQTQITAHPSHPNQSPAYPTQRQITQNYPGMNGIQDQQFEGHPQLSQIAHNYQSEMPYQRDNLQQNQPAYYGDHYIPAIMNYQPESILQDQYGRFCQTQSGEVPFPERFDHGGVNEYSIQQRLQMQNQEAFGMDYLRMAGLNHYSGFSQHYGPPNNPQNGQVAVGFMDHPGSLNESRGAWVNENQGFIDNRPRAGTGASNRGQMRNMPPNGRAFGSRAPSNNFPSGPPLGRTLSLNEPKSRDFRGRGKPYNPRYVSAGFDNHKQSQKPPAPISSHGFEPVKALQQSHPTPVGPLKDNVILTPHKVTTASTSKNPTPVTARQLGEVTPNVSPVLRSRRHQSVADASLTFKIDPLKGSPPAFWPGGKLPVNVTEDLSPRSKMSSTRSSTGFSGHGIDPFTNNSTFKEVTSQIVGRPTTISRYIDPQDMVKPTTNSALAVLNPLVQTQPQSGFIGSLLLNNRPQNGGPSRHMSMISPNGAKPTIDIAFDPQNMPFVEPARGYHGTTLTGVVRISNIPYSVTRQEIMAFLGRNARLINEIDEPIHIIMERATSKTMDAYVEFVNITEAVNSVTRYDTNRSGGRGGRLGERHVDLEVVGHDSLMRDLFPKAKNVQWNGSEPQIMMMNARDPYNSGFQGFVTREELVMLVKHVEAPQRSPFSRECPQRPYECLISTLVKYPWYMVDYVTLEDRNLLFKAARDMAQLLQDRVNEGTEDISINYRLFKRVQRAIFNCAGFSEAQKDDIAFISGIDPSTVGLPPYPDHWSVFHVIGAKRGWESDVIQYYQALLREATTSSALVTLAERSANGNNGVKNVFGNINIEYPEPVSDMTLAAIGHVEWDVIEALLRKVLDMNLLAN